jgi:cysteine desulfurase
MAKPIYLDYQSAKPVDPRVIDAMAPYHWEKFGNPSSLHKVGDVATEILDQSRETIAGFIGAEKNEIIFTSGATESNNQALIGYAMKNKSKGNHIIISEVEHISILNLAKYLEKQGFSVSYVPVDQYGRVILRKLEERITPQTILISIGFANNEIGTIQPIDAIGEIARKHKIAFHTDAVAAEGLVPIDVNRSNIDLMSLSSNDIYGPKGLGALYLRRGLSINPLIIGGGQERGLRSGSENIPAIVGMKWAVEIMKEEMNKEVIQFSTFRDFLIKNILKKIPDSHLNGHPTERLPNNAHFRFAGIEGESMLLSFKDLDISVSTGSACSSKTLEPSHTLLACGLIHEEAHGSLELTLGRWNTQADVDRVVEVLPGIVERLRNLSPIYKKKKEA